MGKHAPRSGFSCLGCIAVLKYYAAVRRAVASRRPLPVSVHQDCIGTFLLQPLVKQSADGRLPGSGQSGNKI